MSHTATIGKEEGGPTVAQLRPHARELHRGLREAISMLNHVGFGDDSDPSYERMWRKHLRGLKAIIAKAEGRQP